MIGIYYKLSVFIYLLFAVPVFCIGQGEEMLSRFSAAENAGRVDVVWTMRAGNLCLGIDVERTIDTVNGEFEKVHSIAGECGDERVDVTYRFADLNPVEGRVNYYRLILGAVPTTFRTVEVPAYGGKPLILMPNPANNRTLVRYKNPDREVFQLQLFTLTGELVLAREELSGDSYDLTTSHLVSGTYILRLTSQKHNYNQKLIISR